MTDLIKPEEVSVKDSDGIEKTFIISKLPAMVAREVIAKYPVANAPKIGEYKASEDAMLKMMAHVAVHIEGREPMRLNTRSLIDNHVTDGEQLLRLEMEMLRYNTSFFGRGGNSDFLGSIIRKYLPLITQTLTDSLQQSSQRGTPPSQS